MSRHTGAPPYLAAWQWYKEPHTSVSPRRRARAEIEGTAGRVTLSVPVAGGARVLRNPDADPDAIPLSLHGNWPHAHLAALDAAYMRTPYYIHYRPYIASVYTAAATGEITTLGQLNRALSALLPPLPDAGRVALLRQKPALQEAAGEMLAHINPELPMLHALFHLGPRAIIPLILG